MKIQKSQWAVLLSGLAFLGLWGCTPEGFINKVKYRGETVLNTCETFSEDVKKVIENNASPDLLPISKQDNSSLPYYHLEPGQFELKGDSLYFRLKDDIDYPRYLEKGVAVIVSLKAWSEPRLQAWGPAESIEVGKLVIDRKYYVLNRRPFFTYRFPLKGKSLVGKRISLSFGIAQYNSDGSLKKTFCETASKPIGPLEPACCSATRWEGTQLQSIVEIPPLNAQPDTFVYESFDALFDVTFQEGVYDYPDSLLAISLQSFIEKYARLQYQVSEISLTGYASPLGANSRNQRLSERRAEAVAQSLKRLNASRDRLPIRAEGRGEDWLKVEELLTRSQDFSPEEKEAILAIIQNDQSNDAKESSLRRLAYWKKIQSDLFAPARHTAVNLSFAYIGPRKTVSPYPEPVSLLSRKTEQLAKTEIRLTPYQLGADIESELARINEVLRFKASANLYALRATYHLAQKNYRQVYEDLKTAQEFEPTNQVYDRIILGYKIKFFQEASPEAIVELYNEINQKTEKFPRERSLFLNRAILFEKMGLVDRALREYALLFDGENPNASHINNRGVARLKANLVRAAESDFLQAIDRNETLAEPHFNLAALYAYRGLTARSMTYLDKAIDRNPRYRNLIFNNPVFAIVSEDPKYDKYR